MVDTLNRLGSYAEVKKIMSYKSLNLDQGKIQELLAAALPEGNASPLAKKGNAYESILKEKDGEPEGLIHFFYNNDGTTSINDEVGKNQALSKRVAAYIKDNATIDERKNFALSFKNIEHGNVELLLEYLRESAAASITTEDVVKPKHILYRVQGPSGDSLVFKHYENGTLQIQGKPLRLYQETISFLSEWLPLDDVIKSQSAVYNIDIKPDQVRYELQALLPTSHLFLGETLIKILSSAISLRKIHINLDDYSAFVFPALRGLEGYIKKLFANKGMLIGREGFADFFTMNSTRSRYLIIDEVRRQISCPKTCEAIQNAYSIFSTNRHVLFHTDATVDASRIITKRQEADDLITTILGVIEETYSRI